MADVAPTITVLSSPAVSVTSINNLSYGALQQSIGSYSYLLNSIYEYTEQTSQLLQPVGLKKYNAKGTKQIYNLQMAVDPYQDQASIHQDTIGLDYAFDGNNNFYFYLEANTYAQLQFDIVEIAPIFFLNKRCLFEEIEFLSDASRTNHIEHNKHSALSHGCFFIGRFRGLLQCKYECKYIISLGFIRGGFFLECEFLFRV